MSLVYLGPYSLTTSMEMENPRTVSIFYEENSHKSFHQDIRLAADSHVFLFLSLVAPHPPLFKKKKKGWSLRVFNTYILSWIYTEYLAISLPFLSLVFRDSWAGVPKSSPWPLINSEPIYVYSFEV